MNELRTVIEAKPNAEVVFLMIARAPWHAPSPILSFCFCRRTYCHHLVIDFAANHPNAIGPAGGEVKLVGPSVFYSLVKFAHDLNIRTIWGEATEQSARFYQRTFGFRRVSDHFFIRGTALKRALLQHELLMKEMQD